MASIRGNRGSIKLFKNGSDVELLNVTSFEVNQDTDFMRSNYVGSSVPEGDQSQQGWSGSIDVEVKDSTVDDIIDAIVNNNLAGVGADEFSVLLGEEYPDGGAAYYAYSDVQLKMSKRNPGQTEKITKRLDFQASFRTKL